MRPTVPSLTAAKDGLGRVAWWLAAPLGLMTLYCVAFLVRVLVAPHAGFGVDVADQKYWAVRLAAAGVLFTPAVLAVGALWGQVDVIPAFFLVWSMLLLFTREQTLQREIAGIALLALAFAVKPQTAVALPAPALAFWWRHLRGRWRDWPRLRAGAVRLAILGAVAFAVWAAPGIPFGLGPAGLV